MSSLQICHQSLHISSILTCPSSVSWLYIIFHMKTNIYKYKNLPTKRKNLHSNASPNILLLSTLLCSTHSNLLNPLQICSTHSKFALRTPNLLHTHQGCSTHSKFAPPTPNLLRPLIFRHLPHVSTLYQYKTKTHKSLFFAK